MRHVVWRPNRNLSEAPPSAMRCRESVHHGRMGSAQCSKKPVVWEDVDGESMGFCRQHSLVAQQERAAKREEKYQAQRRKADRVHERGSLEHDCFDAVDAMSAETATAAGIRDLWQRVQDHVGGEP